MIWFWLTRGGGFPSLAMASFQIVDWSASREGATHRLHIQWRLPSGERVVHFDFPEALGVPAPEDLADGMLSLSLFSAMHQGLPLSLPQPVSAQMLEQQQGTQEIAALWFQGLQEVPVEATARPAVAGRPPLRAGASATFTAGVDSMLTVLDHREELDFLIHVQGFGPIEELEDAYFAPQIAHLKKVAEKIGLPLHLMKTDYRRHQEVCVPWMDNHGAALATIGLWLGQHVGKFYIASSNPWTRQNPWGSSHWLDERWSNERVRVRLHGQPYTRPEKVARLVQKYPEFVPDLAVCWTDGVAVPDRNCGTCEKCMRTMCGLVLAGYERLEGLFQAPLDLERVRTQPFPEDFNSIDWRRLLDFGVKHAPDHPALDAIRSVVAETYMRRFTNLITSMDQELETSPEVSKLGRVMRDDLWKSWKSRQGGWLRKKMLALSDARPADAIKALWGKDAL